MQVPGIGDGPLHAGGRLPQDRRRRQPARPHLDSPRELPASPGSCWPTGLRARDVLDDQRPARGAPREAQDASRRRSWPPGCRSACRRSRDILDALARPGRDPREDLPPPIFKKGILKLEDLQPGMELKGTVLNVVDFGAFVDIGLKDSGLVHISQMANRYIKSPYDVVAVGDVVTVWVLTVDKERHRVSLTMIQPGTERKPPEKKPMPPRREGPPRRAPAAAAQEGRRAAGRRPSTAGRRPAATGRPAAARRPAATGRGGQRTAAARRAPSPGRSAAGRTWARAARRRRRDRNGEAAASSQQPPPRKPPRRPRRSRTCRRRPSPAPRRSAPSPNWPRSGTRRRRKMSLGSAPSRRRAPSASRRPDHHASPATLRGKRRGTKLLPRSVADSITPYKGLFLALPNLHQVRRSAAETAIPFLSRISSVALSISLRSKTRMSFQSSAKRKVRYSSLHSRIVSTRRRRFLIGTPFTSLTTRPTGSRTLWRSCGRTAGR